MDKRNSVLRCLGYELKNIVQTLNYSSIICRVKTSDYYKLKRELVLDNCNHMERFKHVLINNLFFIENCDLQDVYFWSLNNYSGYTICDIEFTVNGFILSLSELSLSDLEVLNNG